MIDTIENPKRSRSNQLQNGKSTENNNDAILNTRFLKIMLMQILLIFKISESNFRFSYFVSCCIYSKELRCFYCCNCFSYSISSRQLSFKSSFYNKQKDKKYIYFNLIRALLHELKITMQSLQLNELDFSRHF